MESRVRTIQLKSNTAECGRIVYLVAICRLALLEAKRISLGTITIPDGHMMQARPMIYVLTKPNRPKPTKSP